MTVTAEDRLEIEDLASRYNLAIDLGDTQGWVDCFLPTGELVIEKVGPWSGPARGLKEGAWRGTGELTKFAHRVTTGSPMRHWSFNRVLTASGDGIDAVSYMNVQYLDSGGAPEELLTGIMRDHLERAGGSGPWRFASRRIAFDR